MSTLPPVLEAMFESRASPLGTPIHSNILKHLAEALQRVTAERQPGTCVEIGMAFGFSTLSILSGTAGLLISIDPRQSGEYRGEGAKAVALAGYDRRHRLIEQPSYIGLPQLLIEGTRAQFAYIDGMHTFDHVLLDFFYVDKMLDPGGVVAFNDCGMPAVARAIQFVQTHRRYRELSVGLPRGYFPTRNPLEAWRRRRDDEQWQDRYFEKVVDYEPAWDFYRSF